jgi:hypothetical protein
MVMISNIKRFELSASLGWVKLTRRQDGEEILLYPEDALNLAAWVAQNQEALAEACQRLEAEEELARRSVGAPDLPTRQEVRQADPTVPRIAQRAIRSESIGSTGRFTDIASRLPASWTSFQDRTWHVAQSREAATLRARAARCATRGRGR